MKAPKLENHILELLATNIKAARKKLGISQMELAKRLDLSVGYTNDLEGSRRWVGIATLTRLCEVLRLKPYQLLLEEEDSSFSKYNLLTEVLGSLKESVTADLEKVVMGYLSEGKSKPKR